MSKRMTPAQVAARLGLTVKRIYALIDARKLDAIDVSIGNERPRWRIDERTLEAFEVARTRNHKKQGTLSRASAT